MGELVLLFLCWLFGGNIFQFNYNYKVKCKFQLQGVYNRIECWFIVRINLGSWTWQFIQYLSPIWQRMSRDCTNTCKLIYIIFSPQDSEQRYTFLLSFHFNHTLYIIKWISSFSINILNIISDFSIQISALLDKR